ncbi:hypothetical protein L6452_27111 [Arctium lappa]|uniref:Uncharacterized protein n=1 Tax=Arctium lappa TaxID=4217 RepID=A0ACB8ZWN3_ARCLA|nr:hypothetical protein L6452_27111 [Arctium lappa]
MGDLSYLEMLDVKHISVDSLPDSIWKLKQLHYVNLNNIRLAMPPNTSLTLLTLWGLVLYEMIKVMKVWASCLINLSTNHGSNGDHGITTLPNCVEALGQLIYKRKNGLPSRRI